MFRRGSPAELAYSAFTISVPPAHRRGQIEWPTQAPDAATSFVTVGRTDLDRLAFERASSPQHGTAAAPTVAVFVHGYNRSLQEGIFRLAQMTVDSGFDGEAVLFAWPSQAEVTGYVADKDAATAARDGLVELLTMLAPSRDTGSIALIGHSMGGWLAVEAVRQLRLNGRDSVIHRLSVVLAAPDIDLDVFRSQMAVIGPMRPPMTALVSPDDVALAFSSRIAGGRPRLGSLDVGDAEVQELAQATGLTIVDISTLAASDRFNHDRFVSLAALYPKLSAAEDPAGGPLRRAGAFVFEAAGATLSRPREFAGRIHDGE